MAIPRFGENPNCLALAAMPSAARLAREYVGRRLKDAGFGDITDTAAILTSELVTNAVNAVGIVEPVSDWMRIWKNLQTIAVCCYQHESLAVVEVWDNNPHPPVRRTAKATDETGRGLELIEALSVAWGYRWPRSGGKVVWCTLK
jgi:anti-sigma regulatory factor (Ser/Thr protein kinase)